MWPALVSEIRGFLLCVPAISMACSCWVNTSL